LAAHALADRDRRDTPTFPYRHLDRDAHPHADPHSVADG